MNDLIGAVVGFAVVIVVMSAVSGAVALWSAASRMGSQDLIWGSSA